MRFVKRDIKQSGSGGPSNFLKFKDGESKTGVLRGEVYEFFTKWEHGKSHVVANSEPGGKPRFRVNVVIYEDKKFQAKIWEFSQTVCNQLADIQEEYDLSTIKVKITRRGSGMDTTWMILPLLKEPLAPNLLKEIEAVPLNILEHQQQIVPEMPPNWNNEPMPDEENFNF